LIDCREHHGFLLAGKIQPDELERATQHLFGYAGRRSGRRQHRNKPHPIAPIHRRPCQQQPAAHVLD
jgi:hypothetical protein